jgi:hypothetical protein
LRQFFSCFSSVVQMFVRPSRSIMVNRAASALVEMVERNRLVVLSTHNDTV